MVPLAALAAHGWFQRPGAHGFAYAMAHGPRGVVLDLQNAVQLMTVDALLGSDQEVDCLKSLVQWSVAVFEDCADAHRELLQAVAALLEAEALGAFRVLPAGLGADSMNRVNTIHGAAARADRTIGPHDVFKLREGGNFIMKMFFVQYRHGLCPLSGKHNSLAGESTP